MANPLNHSRMQRRLAALFLFLVLLGVVGGAARALRATPQQPATSATHHRSFEQVRR